MSDIKARGSFGVRNTCALVGAFFLMFAAVGTSVNGLSMFYVPVSQELGFTQSQFSLTLTLISLPSIFLGPVVGDYWTKNFDKFRRIILIFGIPYGLTLSLMGLCTQLWHFYAVSLLRGALVSFTHVTLTSMLINIWFPRRRAVMTSIAMIGSSLGGLFFTQVSRIGIEQLGWRGAYMAEGFIAAAFFVLIAVLVKPVPGPGDLRGVDAISVERESGEKAGEEHSFSLRSLVRMPIFWLVAGAYFIGILSVMGIQQCITTSLQLERGYSADFAAMCYSVFTVAAIVGKLIVGWVYDKFGLKKGMLYILAAMVASCLCFLASGNPAMAVAACVLFGLGNMASTISSTVIAQELFGLKDYARIYGVLSVFINLSIALGMSVSSFIYDMSGSYDPAWVVYIVLNVLYVAAVFFAKGRLDVRKRAAEA